MDELKIIGWTNYNSECQNMLINEDNQEEVMDIIRTYIVENKLVFTGEMHQSAIFNCVPVFNNGKCFRASMRTIGMLMSLAYSNTPANYMEYYMNETCPHITNTVKEEIDNKEFVIEDDSFLLPVAVNNDLKLVYDAVNNDMHLMTTDVALQAIYGYLLNTKNKKI